MIRNENEYVNGLQCNQLSVNITMQLTETLAFIIDWYLNK